jgi:hypothetical protein
VSTSNCEKQEKEKNKSSGNWWRKKLTGQSEERNPAANENIPEIEER